MKQYCRYCTHLTVNNEPFCGAREEYVNEAACKRVNRCKDFQYCDCDPELQDAFGENLKGYRERNKNDRDIPGQMSFDW